MLGAHGVIATAAGGLEAGRMTQYVSSDRARIRSPAGTVLTVAPIGIETQTGYYQKHVAIPGTDRDPLPVTPPAIIEETP